MSLDIGVRKLQEVCRSGLSLDPFFSEGPEKLDKLFGLPGFEFLKWLPRKIFHGDVPPCQPLCLTMGPSSALEL